jgi:hypothetical protein
MDPGKIDVGAIGFDQGPQKLNDGSGKTNYPGTIDRGFTVYNWTTPVSPIAAHNHLSFALQTKLVNIYCN